MNDVVIADIRPAADCVNRFAYRIVLRRNALDTASTMIVAEIQFGVSHHQNL